MKTNKYVLALNKEDYIIGFHTTNDDKFDFEGQLANITDLCEGWYKFEDGDFIVDEKKKAEIIAEREQEEKERERESERLLAQIEYTAMMTDTLLEK